MAARAEGQGQSGAAMTKEPLRRVTRASPCPVCGRPDWCTVSADGHLVICMPQAEWAAKHSATGGYVHVLRNTPFRRDGLKVRTVRIEGSKCGWTDLDRLAEQCQEAVDSAALQALADSLGLSTGSLRRLRIGRDLRRRAWTFPMVNSAGQVVGIRLRFPNGRKLAVTGGHEGLFIPDGLDYAGPLIMAEGPTDCAALLDMEFSVIGRPSCSGGVRHCIEVARAYWPVDVVVMADGDQPGQRGAESLASALLAVARSVRVIWPPQGLKDGRAWRQAGATRVDVERAIEAAPVRKLAVRCGATGIAKGR